ncbi:ATP-binding protein [Agrobacterium sp. SHOUNA12C]|uniref:ATP-binding protein n=1 Tax=Rhizobium TaxID=379 RepID=UPI00026ED089|nr:MULTISPECIES: ATP-binding protein [Rhizobium]KAA6488437.1 HAMP domain-containing protein [Agrobacterium sp. ICMP 7243]MCJ9719440.1 ATP-binding protein [Agrobacterium sp. BETTINA12B]MCJ9755710.1 ATP-binding protein [Agrobacterium sp. SHOUNA12C]EJK81352.1 signal transduction histidine kinase [Rhizobium sp. AP16]NTF52043.1 HAMP domain-containing protein [Rhizobium rhizogenes]
MKSLGARLALLLLTAIVLVVITSSFVASLVMRGPRPDMTMEPVAHQLSILATFAENDRSAAVSSGLVIAALPADGPRDEHLSRVLMEALSRIATARYATITRQMRGETTASIKLSDGNWMMMPMPEFGPPPDGWTILVGWLGLIITGSVLVSIFAASKIMKPLRLLERAVAEMGPDGTLPHVPETGPGEIRVTAQALNGLSARVKAATESRMRLVAAAGHDLRTPMTRMRLRAEFIKDDEDRRKWLSDLEELDTIADSAIGLVREEISSDGLQCVRLDTIVGDIVEELAAIGMNIESGELQPASISAGVLALTRALRNLLINAATHGESAVVTVAHFGDRAIVRILDTGPGIPEERLNQVFEPFFRIDIARQRSFPGAGLGMAIAKEIISRFDGEIVVRNRHPRGLEQLITFKTPNQTTSGRLVS